MKKPLTLALCLLLFIAAYAQKNLKGGYVVLNNNDTLTGFIDYREWYKNPNSIMFSPTKETRMQRYKARDIRCFTISGKEMYQRHNVKISMDRYTIGNISEKDTSSRTDAVFLKVLQRGKNITLFSYADDVKERLYILPTNETTPVELQNSEYILNGQMISEQQYRPILSGISRRYMPGAEDIQTLILTQNFSPDNISDICYRINGISQETVHQEKKNKLSHFRYFAGIGANQGRLSFEGNNRYAGKTNDPSYGVVINAGADFIVNPAVGKLFFRTQLSVSGYKTEAYAFTKYYAVKENYYLKVKQTNVALHEQLNYNLYNGQRFKWFVGAGAGFNFSSYPLNEEKFISEAYTDTSSRINNNYISKIKKFWLNACFISGFTIRNLDVSLAYYPKSSISQYSHYVIANSSLQLQVKYLFY